ncbi:unnamed protein product, partial [marine sediment metagenome]
MNRSARTILISTIALVIAARPVVAQTAPTELEMGDVIQREISVGEVHPFSVDMDADQFLLAVVEQRGVDVAITA